MTKEEAKQAIRDGYRVTHFLFFGSGEYIKQSVDPNYLLDEDGIQMYAKEFWQICTTKDWQTGWSIIKKDTETYFIGDPQDSERILKELRRLGALDDHLYCNRQFLYLVDQDCKCIKAYHINSFVGQLVMEHWKRGVLPKERETIVVGNNRYFLEDVEERVNSLTPLA